jgi:hypothetical protein
MRIAAVDLAANAMWVLSPPVVGVAAATITILTTPFRGLSGHRSVVRSDVPFQSVGSSRITPHHTGDSLSSSMKLLM